MATAEPAGQHVAKARVSWKKMGTQLGWMDAAFLLSFSPCDFPESF